MLCTGATEALSAAAEEWKGAMTAVDDKMADLQRMLIDNGSECTALEELQTLLIRGQVSTGLLMFLTSHLGKTSYATHRIG